MRIRDYTAQSDVVDAGFFQIGCDFVDQSGTDGTLAAIVDQDLSGAVFF